MDISRILITNRDLKKWTENVQIIESGNYLNKDLNISILQNIINEYFMAVYYLEDVKKCIEVLNYYKYSYINEYIINNTDFLLNYLRRNKKVIATTDVNRKPNDDEIIIVYGDFPLMQENLISNNPCYRHFKFFNKILHDKIEYDDYWDNIDKIYIICMDNRTDRYLETVSELIKLKIPLNKIERFSAIVAKDWGCSASHLEVIKNAMMNNYQNILILEDDIRINSLIDKCRNDIKIFLIRKYEYDVCLLACNLEFCKNIDHDDLLYKINSRVTTTAGYFISFNGMKKVKPIWEDSLSKFKLNPSNHNYACDVSWDVIQKDNKFFQFITKICYQKAFLFQDKTVFHMW